jgi:hypothetical protein
MKRFLACALIAVIGNASAAFAGESLLTSGTRHVQAIAAAPAAATKAVPGTAAALPAVPSYQEAPGPGNLSKSGHSKATKAMIYAALGVGFGLAAWQIDRHVLNITPSSLGQRKD